MVNLYLVRHGENRANLTKEFSHRLVDYSLTAKGELQAQQTAEYFASRPIAAIYTSPLKRAAETAAAIAARLSLPYQMMENFREMNVGALERVPPSQATWAQHGAVLRAWRNGDWQARFPDGENYLELWQRFRDGLLEIAGRHAGQQVVLVAHGGIFYATLRSLTPGSDLSELSKRENGNCSISEVRLRVPAGEPLGELLRWADCSHLHGEAADLVSGLPDESTFQTPPTA